MRGKSCRTTSRDCEILARTAEEDTRWVYRCADRGHEPRPRPPESSTSSSGGSRAAEYGTQVGWLKSMVHGKEDCILKGDVNFYTSA